MPVSLQESIPAPWAEALAPATAAAEFGRLATFVDAEYRQATVYPPFGEVFAALDFCPPERVRAVLLGQDPYHGPGQAHGLAFSVRPGVAAPPSLRNILRELAADLGTPVPESACLSPWARQGVLLLNTVLTVRRGEANSHRRQGWERFTDAVIRAVNRSDPTVFILWGNPAAAKEALVDGDRHLVLKAPHPSPLSAHRGFFGSRPFSRANEFLASRGRGTIDWSLAVPAPRPDQPDLPLFESP